jgi:hypothetical protein
MIRQNEHPAFTKKLCHWIYTGPHLLPAMQEWLISHMNSQEQQQFDIDQIYRRWQKLPAFQGEIFAEHRPYDPRLLGDTPSALFNIGATQIIRTPAITTEGSRTFFGTLTQSRIAEEFLGHLDYCRCENKTHLYINLMAPYGSEKVRTEALLDLETQQGDLFHLLTLSKDCSFYHQTGPFKTMESAQTFKEAFLHELFHGRAYHWPRAWDLKEAETLCEQAIEETHSAHFPSQTALSFDERRTFIELAYTCIIEKLILHYQPTICNISCRSCVDRGAASLSLLYRKTHPNDRATFATLALGPAIFAQSRLMLSHRFERLAHALKKCL